MSFNSIIGAALQTLGQQIVAQMKVNLVKNRSNASGYLSNSIQSEPKQGDKGPYIDISMAEYGGAVDSGRSRSTKGGPKQTWAKKIVNWIRLKGITPRQGITQKQLAFLITRKINRKGYQAKPFIQPAINEVIKSNLDITMNKAVTQALNETLDNIKLK
jgi:hypothetical protein